MRWTPAVLLVLLFGCGGGESPVAPSPVPAPVPGPIPAPAPPSTFSGSIVDTVSGAPVAGFTAILNGNRVTVSAPGYVTHSNVRNGPRIDLIPESRFDLNFYRQFARGSLDGSIFPLRTLPQSPSFYMEVEGAKGLSAQVATQLEAIARRIVPELTGGRLRVDRWETGPTARAPQEGWIVVERRDEEGICGESRIGATAGQIYLDGERQCRVDATFAHEVGHALGFWHVDIPGSLMYPQTRTSNLNDSVTERERRHAAIAYSRPRGNTDVDVDP